MMGGTLQDELRERELLPHQAEFILTALGSGSGSRLLLADAVGLGKTRACVALVWAWSRLRGRQPRTLILAPRALLPMWHESLADFEVDADIVDAAKFRHVEARTPAAQNPWTSLDTVITTVDFLKRHDRLRTLLKVFWDLVIVDEAHLGTGASQAGEVLRALWDSDEVDVMVAASATPSGRLDDLVAATGRTVHVLRRSATDLVDWEGRPILGGEASQVVEIVRLQLTPQEHHLLEVTRSLLQRSAIEDPSRRLLVRFYVRAAASSLFMFENLLRRALVRADRQELTSVVNSQFAALEVDDYQDMPEATLSSPLSREDLLHLIELIDMIEVDTKWSACSKVLQARLSEGGGSAVIFCDFAYTAQYVAGLVSKTGTPVQLLMAAKPAEERDHAVQSFQQNGGVLVLTSAAAEGVSLAYVKLCVHYDLPWDWTVLARRLGRIHRIGAGPGPVRHVLFADEVLLPEPLVKMLFSLDEDAAARTPAEVLTEFLGTP
jgi:superfamily II DNA or RNA helicase